MQNFNTSVIFNKRLLQAKTLATGYNGHRCCSNMLQSKRDAATAPASDVAAVPGVRAVYAVADVNMAEVAHAMAGPDATPSTIAPGASYVHLDHMLRVHLDTNNC